MQLSAPDPNAPESASKDARKWWQKKRIIIPAAILGFVGFGSAIGGGGQDAARPAPAVSSPARSTPAPVSPSVTPAPAPATSSAPAPATSEPAAPTLTVSQRNAVRKAESYLEFSGFSRKGLVEQLEYEGFSTDDATFAVDNVGADWMVQAERKAKSYLESSSFSRKSLVEQLKYEGFTTAQATHGAAAAGL